MDEERSVVLLDAEHGAEEFDREAGREDLPIRVVVRPDQAERYADLLGEVQVWTSEPTVADLDGFAAQVEATDRLE